MKYAYYPGCSLHSTGEEFDRSLLAVCDKLGIELVEVKKWLCCGSSAAHNISRLLAISFPLANLALLDKMGLDEVVVPCAMCFSKFKTAQHNVKSDDKLRADVEEVIQHTCNDKAKIIHPLEIFTKEPLLSKIPTVVERELTGLKIVCYYGCLITRPPKVAQFDVCEYPESMDRIIGALGATTLDWSYKTDCCGASFALTKPDIVVELSHRIIEAAKSVGADAIAVACPLCHANLDTRQPDMEKAYDIESQMPILYFTQLMGYSFGISPKELLVDKHLTDAEGIFEEVGQHA
jgi:heterodisulfide reductase subunit B